MRRLCLTALLVVVGLTATTTAARAVLIQAGGGRAVGAFLKAGTKAGASLTPAAAAPTTAAASSSGQLDYHGGPVLHTWRPFVVYWDPGGKIPPSSRQLIERYLQDVTAGKGPADVFSVLRQYTDATGFASARSMFSTVAQTIVDTRAYPASCAHTASTYPRCVNDAQLSAELSRLISARGLPSGTGEGAPIYLMVTPSDVNVCLTASRCTDNSICAYHSAVQGTSPVLYAAIPLFFNGASPAQDPKSCQSDGHAAVQEPNADPADVALSYISHELAETVTDPLTTSWWDSSTGQEAADNCNAFGAFNPGAGTNPRAFAPVLGGAAGSGTLYDQSINDHPYYTQSEWSNGDGNCELQPSPSALSAAFSGPAEIAAGSTATFDPSASLSQGGYTSTTWSFGDGSGAFAASGPVPGQHAFSAPGTYTVSVTLVDRYGNSSTASRPLNVTSPPVPLNHGGPSAVSTPSVSVLAQRLSGLRVSPHSASIAGRRVSGKCVRPSASNRAHQRCRRAIKLHVTYTLIVASTVAFTLKRQDAGRRVNGRCVKPTRNNGKQRRCTRLTSVRGMITQNGKTGANSFTFNGSIGGRRLGAGTYQLTAVPRGGVAPQQTTFRIVG